MKHHATLATSAHHLLLCKHVVLVTMQGRQEDKENIEIFGKFLMKLIRKQTKMETRNFILQAGVQIWHPVILLA